MSKLEKNKIEKLNNIIDYLLKEQPVRLNVPTLKTIHEIDPDFDFNRFDFKKMPITIMYRKIYTGGWNQTKTEMGNLKLEQLNTNNCYEEKIYDMVGFKIGTDQIYKDMNMFIENIPNITCIIQNKITDWKTRQKVEKKYYVKWLPANKNIKTLRFVLHSYHNKAHELELVAWKELSDYYINGNPINKQEWLHYSREYKLKRIIK